MRQRYPTRRRRWGRSEPMPLYVVTDDRQAGEAIAVLTRWLFRYRSELAPLTTALFLAGTAAFLHHGHRGLWPDVLALTVVAVAVIVASGKRWLDPGIERAYAAVVAIAAGGWLATATAHGPTSPPLPGLLVAATLICGAPWWSHRRRRSRVRIERTVNAWPDLAETIGLAGSRVLSAVVDLWGWRARLALKRGQTVTDVISRLPAIESGLGTRPGSVRVEPDPTRADHCVLHVLEKDPHARPIPWPAPTGTSVADAVELGVFEDATPVRVRLLHRHALVAGIAGSGKSGILNVILAALTAYPDVVIWGIDLKGGMELQPWASCLDRIATDPRQTAELLADAVTVLDARAVTLTRQGARLWIPTPEEPALIIVADEYAELADESPDAMAHADSIARRGRAVAVTLLAATQRPTQAAMGKGAVRSQMDIRICLRVRERRDTDLILGQGAHTAGWHAHTLDAPGKFLISAPGFDVPRRARAYLLTDERVRATTRAHRNRRPRLDALSADAIAHTTTEVEVIDAEIITDDPEQAFWTALLEAPDEGLSVSQLMKITGMGRTWVYSRLQEHAHAGRVQQVSRGRWRAAQRP
ncbi:FtsK/SpoIIIE domain-containing protein [Actinoallomurus soli]|uniref:FtsK/SpoIIIE domain-containing protein n=1 Tax=Actinoallomurus soli TaxID=2952535 RepID=UPI002092149B|nr:FtsK/SpoIIIE domain-containing protein [Actinoallomurus soli]MCO5968264.1 FtsK/SpoIIIE domain-containing protein [Actinoallomurus soli]